MGKIYGAHPRVIWLWWLQSLLLVLIACLAMTVFFSLFSKSWFWGILGSLFLFSVVTLWYFRFRWKKYSFYIENNQLVISGGVLFTWEERMNIDRIQFMSRKISIFERILQLSRLQVALLGGKMLLYGLDKETADQFEEELKMSLSKEYTRERS